METTPDLALVQQALKLNNKAMGERLGVSASAWCNIRSGRQWHNGVPEKYRGVVEELMAEAGLNGHAVEPEDDHVNDAVDEHVDDHVDDDDELIVEDKPGYQRLIDDLEQRHDAGESVVTSWRRFYLDSGEVLEPEEEELFLKGVARITGASRSTLAKALKAERDRREAEELQRRQEAIRERMAKEQADRPPPPGPNDPAVQAAERDRLAKECSAILNAESVHAMLREDLAGMGVVGEDRIVRMVFLCVTSRLFDKIASLKVHGPSSSGKSFTTETVLKLFPPEAYMTLTSGSEKSLIYSSDDFRHRFVVLLEATPLQTKPDEADTFSYIIRSLLSEGRIEYQTVMTNGPQPETVKITKEGPTGLLVTTTAVSLHAENETRLLSVTTDDSKQQTRAILRAIAAGDDRDAPQVDAWHAFQRWLELGPRKVTVPFSIALAELVDAHMVRMRRDFSSMLALIRANALVHQAHRKVDDLGRIVADVTDYADIRDLVESMVAFEMGADAGHDERRVVEHVYQLATQKWKTGEQERMNQQYQHDRRAGTDDDGPAWAREPSLDDLREVKIEIGGRPLADALDSDQSSVQRWVASAIEHGYLINHHAGQRGKRMLLSIDMPLPGKGRTALPTVEQVIAKMAELSQSDQSDPSDPTHSGKEGVGHA